MEVSPCHRLVCGLASGHPKSNLQELTTVVDDDDDDEDCFKQRDLRLFARCGGGRWFIYEGPVDGAWRII